MWLSENPWASSAARRSSTGLPDDWVIVMTVVAADGTGKSRSNNVDSSGGSRDFDHRG
jgi:hypothetical protein